MIRRVLFATLILSYLAVIMPFTAYLRNRPAVVKLGHQPTAKLLKFVVADQRSLVAEYTILKALVYFGTLAQKMRNQIYIPPEYFNMYWTLASAVKLDPYNQDAYYFAQAALTWEGGMVEDVNLLLIHGMKYRTRDPHLPFYAGFNYAYFLKDYRNAALYFQKAAEISGDSLYATLAARYMYEGGKTDLGIIFLEAMEREAKDENVRRLYRTRKDALVAVKILGDGVERFKTRYERLPRDLPELVSAGILKGSIPKDPYGGRFYLAEDGKIKTTSNFTFGGGKK